MRRITLDLETSGLLDKTAIDYTTTPYRLKPSFKVWCACCIDLDTKEEFSFVGEDEVRNKLPAWLKQEDVRFISAHNGVDFDFLVLKLYCNLDYEVEVFPGEEYPDLFDGRRVVLEDTLVLSRTQNPDRYGGHSLEIWGERLGEKKIDWRGEAIELGLIQKDSPRGAEFQQWHPKMLDYCLQDCRVTVRLSGLLAHERGDWDWTMAINEEKSTAETVTLGSHRGFAFDDKLAVIHLKDLDQKLEERRNRVEPVLPMKPMGKTKLKDYVPPKKQFLKSGEIRKQTIEWVEKHGGRCWEENGDWKANIFGNEYKLPLPDAPLLLEEQAKITDSTFIKGWLITQGWNPLNWKERDLTMNSKKQKLSREKYEETVERYVANTLGTPFEHERCEHLQVTPDIMKQVLLQHDVLKPKKVLTSPTYTEGTERDICKSLLGLQEKFPYAIDVVEYLTYMHRRNSILGGGMTIEDFEDEDGDEPHKGYLAYLREDGRIPTPANPCGAASRRFLHKITVNVPRNTSLYGKEMRSLFGVDDNFLQLGYDFDSLEAVITACLVFNYPGGKEYGAMLTAKKPNDVHSVFARKVSEQIGREFPRSTAKNVVYGATYGASIIRIAKIVGCSHAIAKVIYDAYWELASPLKMAKEELQAYWSTTGNKKFIKGIDNGKIPMRSKNNVINSWCQSAGVICAKRAADLLKKKLKAEGLFLDPFKENVLSRPNVQSLIMYHDEQALEVSKSLVKFKVFGSEDEAKEYKKEYEGTSGKKLSDIGHTTDKYFLAYCRAGELAAEAVKESGEYYELPIPLTAGYSIGRNWKETH